MFTDRKFRPGHLPVAYQSFSVDISTLKKSYPSLLVY